MGRACWALCSCPSCGVLLALHCSFIAPRTPLRPHATALPRAACHTAAALAAVLCDEQVDDALPQQLYLEYFSPDYRLNYNRRPVSIRVWSAVRWAGEG